MPVLSMAPTWHFVTIVHSCGCEALCKAASWQPLGAECAGCDLRGDLPPGHVQTENHGLERCRGFLAARDRTGTGALSQIYLAVIPISSSLRGRARRSELPRAD